MITTAVVFAGVGAFTSRSIRRLGYRAAPFWYLASPRRGERLPSYVLPERPYGGPPLRPPPHVHFMYLDRRPTRERLVPAFLLPREPIEVDRRALVVWLLAGTFLLVLAAATWTGERPLPGILAGGAGAVLLGLAIKGWRQNRCRRRGEG